MHHRVDAVCFGEILWDILPAGARPGGAPMNVAYHLQKLGLQTTLISRVGADEMGHSLLQWLQQAGIGVAAVQTDPEQPTGRVNATVGEGNEVRYDIVYPAAWDFIALQEWLTTLVSHASFFVYGSLAARSATTARTLWPLLECAQTPVLDINLRPPHFSQKLIAELLKAAAMVKLNEQELSLLASWYGASGTDEEQVKLLQDRFDIATLVVTKGAAGALFCQNGHLYRHGGYPVAVADTIGSGDAFLAAFLAQTKAGRPPGERLQFANRLGAWVASKEGACPAYEVREGKIAG